MFISALAARMRRPVILVALWAIALVPFVARADSLSPGQSVVGTGILPSAPQLIINASGGNDVVFVQAGNTPAAYGAPNATGSSIANGCASGDTISDLGSGTYTYQTRKDQYSFGFTRPALSFSLVVLDWGDFLPYSTLAGTLGIVLTGYDANNIAVASQTFSFPVDAGGSNNRNSSQFGNLAISGDACTATVGQPGRLPLAITAPDGKTITSATLHFVDQASMDPLMALTGFQYTLVSPPTNKDQCKDGGWQSFVYPRRFKNQGDCVSFVETGR